MSAVKNLIKEYTAKFAEASGQKRYMKVIELNKEFRSRISGLPDPSDEIAKALEEIAKNPCLENATMWLSASEVSPSSKYLASLCAILEQEKECVWHEGVIYIMRNIKDEYAIPCLAKVLTLNLDYDASKQVAKEAIQALAELGTPEAIEAIKGCLTSRHEQIRDEASFILKILQNRSGSS